MNTGEWGGMGHIEEDERTRNHAFDSQSDSQSGHESLISRRIEYSAQDGLHFESPCKETVDLCEYFCSLVSMITIMISQHPNNGIGRRRRMTNGMEWRMWC